jgi:hypothetical protein
MSQNDNAQLVVPSSVNQQKANRASLGTPCGAPHAKVTLVANCSGNATKRPDGDQSRNSALLPSVIERGSPLFMVTTLSNHVTRSNTGARF